MSQGTLSVGNLTFPAFRGTMNGALDALKTQNSGTSAPGGAAAGMRWLNVSTGTRAVEKVSDGSDWISVTEFDSNANEARPYAGTAVLGRHPVTPAAGTAPDFGSSSRPWGTGYFSAVDVASTGGFTPVLRFGGTAATSSTGTGVYTRIGDLVSFALQVNCTNKNSGTGAMTVTALPFNAENTVDFAAMLRGADSINCTNWSAAVGGGGSTITFYVDPSGTGGTLINFDGARTAATFGAITVQGNYKV